MTWTKQMNLYLDVNAVGTALSPLLSVEADAVSRAPGKPVFIDNDHFDLNIYLRESISGVWTAVELAATDEIVFAAKVKGSLSAASALFSATSFSEAGTGDDLHYTAALDLNTDELEAALASAATADIVCDCEIQNADNSRRVTLQFEAVAADDAYDGDEGASTAGDPVYPVPENIVTKICDTESIADAASSVTIDISSYALAAAPAQVLATVEKPSSSDLNLFAVVRSRSATEIVIDLSAAVDSANYKLHWLAIT
jgi:hypothetical protein